MAFVESDYKLQAHELNENFVGKPFATVYEGTVIFGRIAAIRSTSGQVEVWLADVPKASDIQVLRLGKTHDVHFSRTDDGWETREFVEEIRDILKKHHGGR